MCLGSRLYPNKAKTKKKTNDDNFRRLKNIGTPEGHRSMTSQLNVIRKFD